LGEPEARYMAADHSSLPRPAIAGLFFASPEKSGRALTERQTRLGVPAARQ
jgi:hypothetical protein